MDEKDAALNKEKTQNLEAFSELQLLGRFSNDFEYNKIIHKSRNIVNADDEIIASFREKTDEFFNREAFNGLSPEDIEIDVRAYISSILYLCGLNHNVEIDDVIITGSRSRGLESDGSDLDIVLSYKSPIVEGSRGYKEDELFNLLNDFYEEDEDGNDLHYINGIRIDINPIRPEETGYLSDYLINAEKYLKEKREKLMAENVFGKGNFAIEYSEVNKMYRIYQVDNPSYTVAYYGQDELDEAFRDAKERGYDLLKGSVTYTFDENNNRVPHFTEIDPGSTLNESDPYQVVSALVNPKEKEKALHLERLYTFDEVYAEAENKAVNSPELRRKDEALSQIGDWLSENGYDISGDSREDMIEKQMKAWNMRALFSESGNLLFLQEGDSERLNALENSYSYIYELSAERVQDMLDDFENDREVLPRVLFYEKGETINGTPIYTAIDNAGGHLYSEDFRTLYSVVKYLQGDYDSVESLLLQEEAWQDSPNEGRTIMQLFPEEINELKQRYYIEKLDQETGEGESYGEIANIDNIVTDEEVFEAYEGFSFSEDDFFSKEENKMAEEMKNVNVEQENEGDVKKVYINLHKSYCHQSDSKVKEGELFNTMRMPKGTTLNGQDISGCTIHPKYMNENQKNPNEMTATYYVGKDSELKINLNKDGATVDKVNVEELKEAIDNQRAAYKEEQKAKEQQKEQNKEKDKTKEKDKGEEI